MSNEAATKMPRRASHVTTTLPVTHHLLLLTVVMVSLGPDITASLAREYNPCNNSPSDPAYQGHRDLIPSSFTIKSDCMRAFIDELCKDNLISVNDKEIESGKYERGIPSCKGANCSIECIHYTFCNRPLQDLTMPQESVPQQEVGILRESTNAFPLCDKYLRSINKTAIDTATRGQSCWGKVECTCGMCCESSDQLTVMTMMLDQTYKDLQAHLNSQRSRRRYTRPSIRLGHGTRPRVRVAAYPQRNRQ